MHRLRRAPTALLIDVLGTLVALQPPGARLRAELRAQLGVEVTAAQADRALRAEIAYYRAHMGDGRDLDGLRDLRLRCAGVLRAALPRGDRLDAAPVARVLEALLASLRFCAFDDARPALRRARVGHPRLRIVAVSNWDVSVLEVLEATGLAPLLDGAVCSAAVGAAKPAAEIFAQALAIAGAPAEHAVHVGDSPDEDVAGARACGIAAVLIDRAAVVGRGAVPADVPVIAGLDALDRNLPA